MSVTDDLATLRAEVHAIGQQIAHLENVLRECEDQNSLRVQSLHARLGDLEDLILGAAARDQRQGFTGQAQVPLIGRVPLTLVRDKA